MHIKENATGIQHIGIPTKDMDATIRFYESLGFERLYETRNKEEDDGRVIFFQLHDLVLETYGLYQASYWHPVFLHELNQ